MTEPRDNPDKEPDVPDVRNDPVPEEPASDDDGSTPEHKENE